MTGFIQLVHMAAASLYWALLQEQDGSSRYCAMDRSDIRLSTMWLSSGSVYGTPWVTSQLEMLKPGQL